ncbi:MAG: MFS transporter [Bdellovibrionales bacterium]|nr:MFS transporter [Bdellovibrionales bacterium]
MVNVSVRYPPGLPYIVSNEAAERFSYYGMKCILVVFMTQYLRGISGELAPMTESEARYVYHLFSTANYFFPVIGALIADIAWGKYKTIIRLSIVYCLGHLVLALWETRSGLACGLTLIAIGSGGIKPCVSAHLGDQFTQKTSSLVTKAYSWFYVSINFGAFLSTILTPYLLEHCGPSVAFGVPGAFMFMATIVFSMGRRRFRAIPAEGLQKYAAAFKTSGVLFTLCRLLLLYSFVAVFWSLYDQTGSSWVLQAERMDRKISVLGFFEFVLLPSQVQSLNPVLILFFTPLFAYGINPILAKHFQISDYGRVFLGMVLASFSFVIVAYAEYRILGGVKTSIGWQALAYVVLTLSEVMVSITVLELSYRRSPAQIKSLVMGLFYLSVALGNAFTALVNYLLSKGIGASWIEGSGYYLFFAVLMAFTAFLFLCCQHLFAADEYFFDEVH